MTAPILVVMGVSGAGKSTVGACLAERMDFPFLDGDALHPATNVTKMAAGVPLTHADRAPWLDKVAGQIAAWRAAGTGGVIACSALQRAYRDRLAGPRVRFVYLAETPEAVHSRVARRQGHFMPASLIDSQFAALEAPEPDEHAVISLPERTVAARCDTILQALQFGLDYRSDPITAKISIGIRIQGRS